MRSAKTIAVDIFKKPPFTFPIIGAAQLLWFIYTLWQARNAPFPALEWLQPLWMLCFTICWLACSDLKQWGGWGYIILTCLDIILHLTVTSPYLRDLVTGIFPIDIMFCLFVLFYFRKFE